MLASVSPITFLGSAIIALGLILYASLDPNSAAEIFATAKSWITAEAGWFYLISVAIFVVFLLYLACSRVGSVKLGPDDSTPEYNFGTWVAMLFSAGMGIGIVFYGVAEPIMHFANPPDAAPRTPQAARDAMEVTFFHWGIHAWSIYALVGLALAYFGYRQGQPLIIRSAFYPILGDRIHGPIGDVIDIFAVVGTLAGLATSLGLGVAQLNASMSYLFDLPQTLPTQLVLIAIVTVLATITVATGLDVGIRRLSEMIIIVSFVLMFLIMALGPTRYILTTFVENLGLYASSFVRRTFHIYAYEPTDWVGTWTLFYWGWWMSWAPFVGLFIARISRGRTIRQFLLGVMFAPAGFSFLWFSIFGNTAIWLDLNVANGAISQTVAENMPIALFTVFDYLPWSLVLSWMTGLLVAVYFVTASDAGALVIAMITSNGKDEPALWLRVFWALTCGGVAACLLLAGGLEAVQMAAVIAALPLSVVMLLMCYGLWKALSYERALLVSGELPSAPLIHTENSASWRHRLSSIIAHPSKAQVTSYIDRTVAQAFESVASELVARDLDAKVEKIEDGLQITVSHGDGVGDFSYAARPVSHPIPSFVLANTGRNPGDRNRYYRAEVFLTQGGRGYDIFGYGAEQIIEDVVNHYNQFRHFLYMTNSTGAPAT